MAALQCEICGGKLIGKPGGIFECDSCGMEYSTEWAKAKIQEIRGTVKVEGTVEVTGKVQVEGGVKLDGPVSIDYGRETELALNNGRRLLKEGKYESAEKEFERVLKLDSSCGDAYYLRHLAIHDRPWECFIPDRISKGVYKDEEEFPEDVAKALELGFRTSEIKELFDKAMRSWDAVKKERAEMIGRQSEFKALREKYMPARMMIESKEITTVKGDMLGGWDKKPATRYAKMILNESSYDDSIIMDYEDVLYRDDRASGGVNNQFKTALFEGKKVQRPFLLDRYRSTPLVCAIVDGKIQCEMIGSEKTERIKRLSEIINSENWMVKSIHPTCRGSIGICGILYDGTAFIIKIAEGNKKDEVIYFKSEGVPFEDICEVDDYDVFVLCADGLVWGVVPYGDEAGKLTHVDDSYMTNIYADTASWKNIIQICGDEGRLYGLSADGKVYAAYKYKNEEENKKEEINISSWENVVAIGYNHGTLCALQADGTLLGSWRKEYCRLFNSIDTLVQEKEVGYKAFLKKQDEKNRKRQQLEEHLEALHKEKASLGLFARKRKQEIDEECVIIQRQLHDNDFT